MKYDNTPFITTDAGSLTKTQEIFCWRMALHGNRMKSYREAYITAKTPKCCNVNSARLMRKNKIRVRINELIKKHREGRADVKAGPWEHYGKELNGVGEKDRKIKTVGDLTAISQVICGADPREIINARLS